MQKAALNRKGTRIKTKKSACQATQIFHYSGKKNTFCGLEFRNKFWQVGGPANIESRNNED